MRSEPVQGAMVRYPSGSLVILTGLPGAGKTTLLQRLYGLHGAESAPVVRDMVMVIDSSQSRRHWDGRMTWAPYPLRRAVVFVTHLTRIRRALAGGQSVIAHNRGCGPYVLRGFAWLARRHGAAFHLLLLDAPAEAALAGQRARGRVVAPRTFARHQRRWGDLVARVKNGDPAPASGARILDRAEAALLGSIVFDGPTGNSTHQDFHITE
ncbi:AAA family ATPase [Nonomuraea turcica]|uniref:AAA family ATPase n=1 Tax=Nonomuraea sp. G32 TaxID=3067274 RepID=UPI00273A8486|nr:ATP-binding protein [Nonomuraea sp. G32]MDP4506150.1 ATP-binding protein [Nonomuraea sp. G32]